MNWRLFRGLLTYNKLKICLALLSLAGAATVHSSAAELTFDAWVDAFSAAWVRGDPNEATTTQYFEGDEQDELDRQLTPITKEFRHARVAVARRGLGELSKYDRAELSEPQRVSAAMLAWQLDNIIRGQEFEDFRLVFQQFSGLQVGLVNFLTQTHPIRNRRDIQNYIVRLGLVAGQIDEGIAQAKTRQHADFWPLTSSTNRPSPSLMVFFKSRRGRTYW
jgi:uncharacterized protein (DUF885 family)